MHATHPSITPVAIAALAYRLWEEAGRPENRDQEFWFTAEHQLSSLASSESGAVAADSPPPRAPRKRKT